MMEKPEMEPAIFNTHHPHLRGHFESYDGNQQYENGEPEFDEIRKEIAQYYSVPFVEEFPEEEDKTPKKEEEHVFIVDNKMVKNQRHQRAFCVVRREKDGVKDAWYIDGRLPHAALFGRLFNHYGIPDDDHNEKILGFLDPDEFSDIPKIQEEAKKRGAPITWFVRETVTPLPEKKA